MCSRSHSEWQEPELRLTEAKAHIISSLDQELPMMALELRTVFTFSRDFSKNRKGEEYASEIAYGLQSQKYLLCVPL